MSEKYRLHLLEEIKTDIMNGDLTKQDLKWLVRKLQALIEKGKIEVPIQEG